MKQLLAPRSVAVVGASANPMAIGGQPIRQLQRHGFTGSIHPVNPNRDEIQGLPCVHSVDELPDGIDMAIVAVAAPHVADIVRACGRKGIPYVAVLSSGFADAGGDGIARQEQLLEAAREANVRVLGPNTVGYVAFGEPLYAGFGAFFEYDFAPGGVSFVTQSGGVGGSLLTILDEEGVRFRHFVHTGNAADLDIESMLDAFVDDQDTTVLLAYIEGLGRDSGFGRVARRALEAGKPLVAWKAGRSAASSSAVTSHTGRLAGDIARYRSVFEHHGVIEVDDTSDLSDVLRLAQVDCVPEGRRVGVVSVSGGAGVIAADCLDDAEHLDLATFSKTSVEQIRAALPAFATSSNPIDVTAQIFNEPELFEKVVTTLSDHNEVDVIIACVASVHGAVGERIAQAIADTKARIDLPIVAVWASRPELNHAAFDILTDAKVPCFRAPERALKALDRVAVLGQARRRARLNTADPGASATVTSDKGSGIDWSRRTETEALDELARYGVRIPRQQIVTSVEQVGPALDRIGGPVVMKIQSPDIAHKAAIGGVRLRITDAAVAEQAYEDLTRAGAAVDGAELRGVAIQEMAAAGLEVICGYLHDDVLGDFLLVGAGGSDVEDRGDARLVPVPASRTDLEEAIRGTRGLSAALHGSDGVAAVVDTLLAIQQVAVDSGGALGELEINPVIVSADGAIAVDALAIARSTH